MTKTTIPQEMFDDDEYEPTDGEHSMANSLHNLICRILQGDLKGIAICAINNENDHSCFYMNKSEEDVLREPLERLTVMYETNRNFMRMDTSPPTNRSYRSH